MEKYLGPNPNLCTYEHGTTVHGYTCNRLYSQFFVKFSTFMTLSMFIHTNLLFQGTQEDDSSLVGDWLAPWERGGGVLGSR